MKNMMCILLLLAVLVLVYTPSIAKANDNDMRMTGYVVQAIRVLTSEILCADLLGRGQRMRTYYLGIPLGVDDYQHRPKKIDMTHTTIHGVAGYTLEVRGVSSEACRSLIAVLGADYDEIRVNGIVAHSGSVCTLESSTVMMVIARRPCGGGERDHEASR